MKPLIQELMENTNKAGFPCSLNEHNELKLKIPKHPELLMEVFPVNGILCGALYESELGRIHIRRTWQSDIPFLPFAMVHMIGWIRDMRASAMEIGMREDIRQ